MTISTINDMRDFLQQFSYVKAFSIQCDSAHFFRNIIVYVNEEEYIINVLCDNSFENKLRSSFAFSYDYKLIIKKEEEIPHGQKQYTRN